MWEQWVIAPTFTGMGSGGEKPKQCSFLSLCRKLYLPLPDSGQRPKNPNVSNNWFLSKLLYFLWEHKIVYSWIKEGKLEFLEQFLLPVSMLTNSILNLFCCGEIPCSKKSSPARPGSKPDEWKPRSMLFYATKSAVILEGVLWTSPGPARLSSQPVGAFLMESGKTPITRLGLPKALNSLYFHHFFSPLSTFPGFQLPTK